MYRRRRFGMRRRSSGLKWYTPALWNASTPQQYNITTAVGPATPEQYSNSALAPIIWGNAPFPGVVNAAGLRAGVPLAERTYLNIRRIVGRMNWYVEIQDAEVTFPLGGIASVHWAIVRMHTNEDGVPDEQASGNYPALATRDNQDEKAMIIAQDVWRTSIPPATTWPEGSLQFLAAEPPLYNMVDVRLKRSFRNEQDCYLMTQFGVSKWSGDLTQSAVFVLHGLVNLRPLGRFGR